MTTRAIDPGDSSTADAVERPHLFWWVAVLGGLTLLGFQGFSPAFYAFWTSHVNPLPGRQIMQGLFIACIPIHVYEAVYVHRLARQLGMHASAGGWAVQTFFLGFPSTILIRRRRPRAAR